MGHNKPTQCYDSSGSSGHEVSQKVFSQSSIDIIPLNGIGLVLQFSNDFHTSFLGVHHYSWDMPPDTSSTVPLVQINYGYSSGSSPIFIGGGGGGSISGTVTSLHIALLIIGIHLVICTWSTGTKLFCPTCWVGRITDGIAIWPPVTFHLNKVCL